MKPYPLPGSNHFTRPLIRTASSSCELKESKSKLDMPPLLPPLQADREKYSTAVTDKEPETPCFLRRGRKAQFVWEKTGFVSGIRWLSYRDVDGERVRLQ